MKLSDIKIPRIKVKFEFISTWHLYFGKDPLTGLDDPMQPMNMTTPEGPTEEEAEDDESELDE